MDSPQLVTVIARGHSGTRMIAQTLYASGVFMGDTVNAAGDKVPADKLYKACRLFAKHVTWNGGLDWDFSRVARGHVPADFQKLVRAYLADLFELRSPHFAPLSLRGWKLPETILAFPWIAAMFPEARFIHLVRDKLDTIQGRHQTDNLRDWGVACERTSDIMRQREISWHYQDSIVRAVPQPKHWLHVTYADFVNHQERELSRLESFLGIPLARIPVRKK